MKTALRTLFVWLLLLALPFQGVAAARMLPAVAGAGMSMSMHAGHAATKAADCPMHHATPADRHDGHHAGTCGCCCIGSAPAPALPQLAAAPPDFIAIPFRAGHVTSADPALPDRPPRFARA